VQNAAAALGKTEERKSTKFVSDPNSHAMSTIKEETKG